MYKEAIRQDLRFPSSQGMLTLQQLWSLKEDSLKVLLINTQEAIDAESKPATTLDFLKESKKETKSLTLNRLRFDVLKDVYITKKQEREEKEDSKATKEYNEGILARIAAVQNRELDNLSIEELTKLLK